LQFSFLIAVPVFRVRERVNNNKAVEVSLHTFEHKLKARVVKDTAGRDLL
jgi:hypothetical protein